MTDFGPLLQEAYSEIERLQSKQEATIKAQREPIAIIGIGCRYPKGGNNPEALWRLFSEGVDAISEVPPERWDVEAYYDPSVHAPNKMVTRWGGFLEDVDKFDAPFFGISGREATYMDPQHRLLLEVAWEALENAGQPLERISGTKTGVFLGFLGSDYALRTLDDRVDIDAYTMAGASLSAGAGRLSYFLNLKGPSMAIDTACSASLLSIHLACQSLKAKESDMALAGGMNLVLDPELVVSYSRFGMLASDGRCKTFDSRANGIVRGDGCGLVVLKRLSDALRDGDDILALIRGSAANQDGTSAGLTAPNVLSQQDVLRAALKTARVKPEQVTYVEAHGTGTPLGDPIEIEALSSVYGSPRTDGSRCLVGSAKTNFGHTEGAAGVTGLLKVVLSMRHKAIPPHLHFKELNPHISFDGTPFTIPTQLTPWESEGPRFGAVSSFSFMGTNVHLILEEAPELKPIEAGEKGPIVLPLSARNAEALQALATSFRSFVQKERPSLVDLAYSAGGRRSHHDHRLAVTAGTCDELLEKLDAFIQGEARFGLATGRKKPGVSDKLTFVFSGQGPQWFAMGRELLEHERRFKGAVERIDALFKPLSGWSLIDELAKDEESSRIQDTEVAQPALFAVQVGLAEVLRHQGIEPDAVLGHSIGEVAAAHVAGVLSLEDAVRVVYHRGRVMQKATGKGRMAAVEFSIDEAKEALIGYEGRVCLGAVNSSTSVTLSGDTEALEELCAKLRAQGRVVREMKVNYAFHSHHLDALEPELETALQEIQPRAAQLPIISSLTGQTASRTDYGPAYWARQMRSPVRFAVAVEALIERGHGLFVELSPHPVLVTAIDQILREAKKDGHVLHTLKRKEPERERLLATLGSLYAAGHDLDWKKLYPTGSLLQLPNYPWQRQRYWIERPTQPRSGRRRSALPSLGPCVKSPLAPGVALWTVEVNSETTSLLADHRLGGTIVFPAAGYVDLMLAAAHEEFGSVPMSLDSLEFKAPLELAAGVTKRLQVAMATESSDSARLKIFCEPASPRSDAWLLLATGSLCPAKAEPPTPVQISQLHARCSRPQSADEHYALMRAAGLNLGAGFSVVDELWHGDREALARLILKTDDAGERLHPTLLDAAVQLGMSVALRSEASQRLFLPVSLDALRLHAPAESTLWAHAVLRSQAQGVHVADVSLFTLDGTLVAEVQGLGLRSLANDPVWSHLVAEQEIVRRIARPKGYMRLELMAAPRSDQAALLESHMKEQFAQVLKVEAASIDSEAAFPNLGVDSLLAMEVKNRLEDSLGLTLATTLIWSHPSISALGEHLLSQIVVKQDSVQEKLAALKNMTPEERQKLLMAMKGQPS